MNTRFHDHSPERRRFLAGVAGLAVLAAVPVTALSASTGVSVNRPRAWLGRFDEQLGRWLPAEHAMREEVPPEQPLMLTIRGPWTLAGTPAPALALGIVYRSLPSRPFLLPSNGSGGIMLHAQASALAGVQVWRQGESPEQGSLCTLNCGSAPWLLPGRYALLIDDTGTLHSPEWSSLARPGDGIAPLRYNETHPPLTGLSVNVVSA